MEKPVVTLDGESLTISDIILITRDKYAVEIASEVVSRIEQAANIVQTVLKQNRRIYGVTTGFGHLQEVPVSSDDVYQLQENLVLSHSAGVGLELPLEVVRGMMVLQINKLVRGHSGVRLEVVELLVDLLNHDIVPVVPSQGSLGASGDLAPLAHLSQVLIGKGWVDFGGQRITGRAALKKVGLTSLRLGAKDGLALLNGTQAMTAIAALAVADAKYLIRIANLATAMSMEVHRANIDALNPLIHQARPHPGQIDVAKEILDILDGSKSVRHQIPHQDAYSLRCVPAVHGAILDAVRYTENVVEVEMNSSTDNPLIFSVDQIYSGGNFHGHPVAIAMDFLGLAMTGIGTISERRVERLLNPSLSGLPAFLAPTSGPNSGLMIAQYTAASLVAENNHLASPASVDSIPVSANQEDFSSMGTSAASKTRKIIQNLHNILAIELLCAAQAIDLAENKDILAPKTEKTHSTIREVVSSLIHDRELAPDISKCVQLIRKRKL
ncbi:MAG: histidine ammonia-lyase [Candidatus Heimdallarchaeota archaeon]